MSVNRFSILALDDEELEQPVSTPKVAEPIKEVRQWNLHEGAPAEVRKWHVDEPKFERTNQKRPFHRGYAFKDDSRPDSRPESRPMRGYSFKDDSPPAQDTKKPTTPEREQFPKLSDYEAPKTPPYPPVDSPILTFADRIKQAMEKKNMYTENDESTLEMYSVIPMKTNLSGPLKFIQD